MTPRSDGVNKYRGYRGIINQGQGDQNSGITNYFNLQEQSHEDLAPSSKAC